MKKRIFAGITALLLLVAFCSGAEEPETDLSKLNGKQIGVQTGTNFAEMVEKRLPDARIETYNTKADLVAALTGHKIDAFVVDEPVARLIARENSEITWIPEYLDQYQFGFVFAEFLALLLIFLQQFLVRHVSVALLLCLPSTVVNLLAHSPVAD